MPHPEQIGFVPEQTYLMFAFEFKLTPDNVQVFARTSSGRVPIKEAGRFAFNGQGQVEIEDEDTNLRLFLPEDYAWAEADSADETVERAKIRRYIYTERGKDYMLVGVPWNWVNTAPKGNLIIDPTAYTDYADDTRLQNATKYGSDPTLIVGKKSDSVKKRTVIKFDFQYSGIPGNATILNAQLQLYYSDAQRAGSDPWVDRWVQAHQLLNDWHEAQADSLRRLTGVSWLAPRAKIGPGNNPANEDANGQYESTVLFWQSETPKWKSWDLTALTQKWIKVPPAQGSAPNYGVILWATNEDVNAYDLRFHSSEYENKQPILMVVWSNTPKTVYFPKDHLGSIRATVLDSVGAPVIGYDDYDPWGYPLASRTKAIPMGYLQGASKNKFTGKEYDDDHGLNLGYWGKRYYDWLIGRWISRDPLAEKYPSLSPYNYSANNPVVNFDPDGRWIDTIVDVISIAYDVYDIAKTVAR